MLAARVSSALASRPKAKATYESTIADLEEKIKLNKKAMDDLETDIETLKGEIAQARGDLVSAEGLLKDDQLYLKDLTSRCEDRAKDWDQRSQLRADELEALAGALEILTGDVKKLDTSANERALLQRPGPAAAKAPVAQVAPAPKPAAEAEAKAAPISRHAVPSLLQVRAPLPGLGSLQLGASQKSMGPSPLLADSLREGLRVGGPAWGSLSRGSHWPRGQALPPASRWLDSEQRRPKPPAAPRPAHTSGRKPWHLLRFSGLLRSLWRAVG